MKATKKCSVCDRPMSDEECGDEFPEERVCDECAGYTPSDIEVIEFHSQWMKDLERTNQ